MFSIFIFVYPCLQYFSYLHVFFFAYYVLSPIVFCRLLCVVAYHVLLPIMCCRLLCVVAYYVLSPIMCYLLTRMARLWNKNFFLTIISSCIFLLFLFCGYIITNALCIYTFQCLLILSMVIRVVYILIFNVILIAYVFPWQYICCY